MNRAEKSKAILLYDQLAAAAKAKSAHLRGELEADARTEYEQQGMAPTWRMPDVGTVILPIASQQIVVADEDKLIAWVADRDPAMVESIQRVNGTHLVGILSHAVAEGDVACDPRTGEVIPGLAVRAGGQPMALSIRPSSDARAIARLHAEGLLHNFETALNGERDDPDGAP